MSIEEKMSALQFEVSTTQTVDEIKRLCTQAAEYAAGRVAQEDVSDDGLTLNYVVRSWATLELGDLIVDIEEGEQQRNVALFINNYSLNQDTLFYIIPLGPKMAPAYKSMKEFSEFLRQKLTDARVARA